MVSLGQTLVKYKCRSWRQINARSRTDMELVKRIGGGEGRGELKEISIKWRTPATSGSKDASERLKSTRHATEGFNCNQETGSDT